jgi:hypothetical protein
MAFTRSQRTKLVRSDVPRTEISRPRQPARSPASSADSDLLFPSETGGFRAASALDKPFRLVGEVVKLKKQITSGAMRRTFQDLARNADIEAIVRQTDLHSTVPQLEIQAAVGAVISLANYRELMQDNSKWWDRRKTETATRENLPSGRFSVLLGTWWVS